MNSSQQQHVKHYLDTQVEQVTPQVFDRRPAAAALSALASNASVTTAELEQWVRGNKELSGAQVEKIMAQLPSLEAE